MTPIGVPSRRSGTPSRVRKSPSFRASVQVYSGSSSTSGIWMTTPNIPGRIFGVVFHIGDLDDFAFKQGTSGDRSSLELNRNILDVIGKFTGEAVGSGAIEQFPLLPGDGATVGLTEPRPARASAPARPRTASRSRWRSPPGRQRW